MALIGRPPRVRSKTCNRLLSSIKMISPNMASGGKVGVLADLYLSRDDKEAVRYDNEPETFKDREQFRNFTELELSTLWAKIRGIEWDVNSLDEFHSVLVRDGNRKSVV